MTIKKQSYSVAQNVYCRFQRSQAVSHSTEVGNVDKAGISYTTVSLSKNYIEAA